MLEFDEIMVLTGVEKRTSKEGREYILIRYLNTDGQTFSTVADVNCVVPGGLQQLDRVNARLKVIPGRYVQLKTLSLEKVD